MTMIIGSLDYPNVSYPVSASFDNLSCPIALMAQSRLPLELHGLSIQEQSQTVSYLLVTVVRFFRLVNLLAKILCGAK